MAIQNRETTLPGIWAENAQTDIPTPPVAGVTYRDTTLNSTAIDKAWPFKTIVDSSDFNQHAFLQDTLIKEAEQYGVMRWNNTTTYKEGGFCLGQDGKLYQALRDNQGKEPTASPDDWKVFTSGGGFPIGSIGYTLRTEVPEGGAWCDGVLYTKAQFPDVYQMLVDGKLQSTTVSAFDSIVSANGSCGFFGLDTANERFKVPMLKDVYLKAGQAPLALGTESLPNITGSTYIREAHGSLQGLRGTQGCMYADDAGVVENATGGYDTAGNIPRHLIINASRSSSTYRNNAKVNPDHVVYRAYVVLYASAAEASVAQAAEFMTAVSNLNTAKANTDLSNVSSNIDYIVEKYQSGLNWYRVYKSGWIEQGGSELTAVGTKTINLLKPYKNTSFKVLTTGRSNENRTINVSGRTSNTITVTCRNYTDGVSLSIYDWFTYGQGA